MNHRTRGVPRRRERVRVHRSVRIEIAHAFFRARRLDRSNVVAIVHALELLSRRGRSVVVNEVRVEPARDQTIGDGVESFRTLWVVRSHLVHAARAVRDKSGGHANVRQTRTKGVEWSVARRERS